MFLTLVAWMLSSWLVTVKGFDDVEFLPPHHLPFHSPTDSSRCWGHEHNCQINQSFSHNFTKCSDVGDRQTFFNEADFGYVGTKLKSLDHVCQPEVPGDSELLCSSQMQFCTGSNIYLDLRDVPTDRLVQYDMDVLKYDQIGGRCKVKQEFIAANSNFMSALQSWAPEMRNFASVDFGKNCDYVIEEPVFVMKIDASVNMYHHFCDFFNLYSSLHLNASDGSFSRNVRVLLWENQPYRSAFLPAFNVFTKHPIWSLSDFTGRRVCLKKAMFPLLPRMVFGLYYNTPLAPGCSGSGLFKAFSEFMSYRLGSSEPVRPSADKKLKVTLLNRKTPHRNIANLGEVVDKLSRDYQVTVANFTHQRPPFKHQVELIRQTDILLGVHGAGLTHMLFLPDWAAVFELYDCQDPECYRDLARLRGLKHVSWEDPDKLTPVPSNQAKPGYDIGSASAKFQDYKFDPDEVKRLTDVAKEHVLNHPAALTRYPSKTEL